jgi:predicted  nucleic acid-binding Zn-ribbon protein
MISEVKVYYENRINIQEENFNKEKKKLSKIHDEKIAGVLEKNTDLEKKISNW